MENMEIAKLECLIKCEEHPFRNGDKKSCCFNDCRYGVVGNHFIIDEPEEKQFHCQKHKELSFLMTKDRLLSKHSTSVRKELEDLKQENSSLDKLCLYFDETQAVQREISTIVCKSTAYDLEDKFRYANFVKEQLKQKPTLIDETSIRLYAVSEISPERTGAICNYPGCVHESHYALRSDDSPWDIRSCQWEKHLAYCRALAKQKLFVDLLDDSLRQMMAFAQTYRPEEEGFFQTLTHYRIYLARSQGAMREALYISESWHMNLFRKLEALTDMIQKG